MAVVGGTSHDSRWMVNVLAAFFVVSQLSCSSGGDAGPSLASRLEVEEHGDLVCAPAPGSPPSDYLVVLDSVAVPASSTYPDALQTSQRDGVDGEPYYFAKTGLWWRGDGDFEIVVPDDFRDRLAISWRNGDRSPTFSVSADCDITGELGRRSRRSLGDGTNVRRHHRSLPQR